MMGKIKMIYVINTLNNNLYSLIQKKYMKKPSSKKPEWITYDGWNDALKQINNTA